MAADSQSSDGCNDPLLGKVLTLAQAGKAYILLTFILLTSGAMFLHWVLYRKLSPIPLISFLFLYNMAFQKGFLNFLGGCGLAIWALALWLWLRDRRLVLRLSAGTLISGLVYFAHLHAFGVYAITVIAFELASVNWRSEKIWKESVAKTWPAFLQFVPWAVLFLSVSAPGSGGGGHWSYDGYEGILHKVLVGWVLLPNFQSLPDWVSSVLIVLGVALALNKRWIRLDPRIAWGLGALILLVLILPSTMLGGGYGDWRLIIPIAIIASGAVQASRVQSETNRMVAMATVMMCIVIMLRVASVASQWKVADKSIGDFINVLQTCETGSRLFTAVVNMSSSEAAIKYSLSLDHLPAFGVIERQLFVPTLYTGAMQQPIKYSVDMLPIAKQSANNGDNINYGWEKLPCELIQREYNYLLLIDQENDGEAKSCGLQRIHKSGGLELYRVDKSSLFVSESFSKHKEIK